VERCSRISAKKASASYTGYRWAPHQIFGSQRLLGEDARVPYISSVQEVMITFAGAVACVKGMRNIY